MKYIRVCGVDLMLKFIRKGINTWFAQWNFGNARTHVVCALSIRIISAVFKCGVIPNFVQMLSIFIAVSSTIEIEWKPSVWDLEKSFSLLMIYLRHFDLHTLYSQTYFLRYEIHQPTSSTCNTNCVRLLYLSLYILSCFSFENHRFPCVLLFLSLLQWNIQKKYVIYLSTTSYVSAWIKNSIY